jgi:7-cyano-7-deazaguanine synthase
MNKTVVLLSGGLDSSTLVYWLLNRDLEVVALSVRYGQRHACELLAARAVAKHAGVHLVELDLEKSLAEVFAGAKSSQVGSKTAVPIGHYADETMKLTIVPNRNMLLLALAGALAVSIGAPSVAYAAHSGDHAIYPDCRPEFAQAMAKALALGSTIDLVTPFVTISKTEIVRQGTKLRVPFELTYSCYAGRTEHCGVCGTCYERQEAFRDAGVSDPTKYELLQVKEG